MIDTQKVRAHFRDVLKIPPQTTDDPMMLRYGEDEIFTSPDGKTGLIFYDTREVRMGFHIGFLYVVRAEEDGKIFVGDLGGCWEPTREELWVDDDIFYVRETGINFYDSRQMDRIALRVYDLKTWRTAVVDFEVNLYDAVLERLDGQTLTLRCKQRVRTWERLFTFNGTILPIEDMGWVPIDAAKKEEPYFSRSHML